jgi:glycosyltransferase involved in cell wall biosynthesis
LGEWRFTPAAARFDAGTELHSKGIMHKGRQPQFTGTRWSESSRGVMFLIDDLSVGGAERALVNLVNNSSRIRPVIGVLRPVFDLAPDLHPDVEVVCITPPTDDGLHRALTEAGPVRVRAEPRGMPRGLMLLEMPGLLRTSRRLARAARAANCGIVSTFLNRAHTVALTARMLFARDLRVVVNVHELLSDHLDLHFAPYERWMMREFISHAFRRADRILTVADAVTADLVENFGLPRSLITVAHNPVDLIRIGKAGKVSLGGDLESTNTIVAAGRLVRLKGFDVLIRAVARVAEELDVHLLILGDGVERESLEQLIAELDIAHRVTLLGTCANPWQYMARAKALVVPSRTEAFPSVIGEAFALSVPVVATRCSAGVAEYLDDGRCGLLVPPDDVDALARALERIVRDPELRRRLAAAGKQQVEAFDMPLAVAHYEELMTEVAG